MGDGEQPGCSEAAGLLDNPCKYGSWGAEMPMAGGKKRTPAPADTGGKDAAIGATVRCAALGADARPERQNAGPIDLPAAFL